MPVPPAEVSASYTIEGSDGARDAAGRAAEPFGLARDAGPQETMLSGGRAEVLQALTAVIEASLDAGARAVEVRLEVPTEARAGE